MRVRECEGGCEKSVPGHGVIVLEAHSAVVSEWMRPRHCEGVGGKVCKAVSYNSGCERVEVDVAVIAPRVLQTLYISVSEWVQSYVQNASVYACVWPWSRSRSSICTRGAIVKITHQQVYSWMGPQLRTETSTRDLCQDFCPRKALF